MADGHPEAPAFYSHLAYRDVHAAMEWLQRCLGFTKMNAFSTPDGVVRHAEMRFGQAVVMFAQEQPEIGWKSPRDLAGTSQYIGVYIEEIDAHYERAKKAGAKIARELGRTEYGTRSYAVLDPEGHYWAFDTYHPHV